MLKPIGLCLLMTIGGGAVLAHQRHDLCPDPDPRGPSDRPDRHPDPVLCDGQENRADERGRCPDYVPDFFSPVRLHHVHVPVYL